MERSKRYCKPRKSRKLDELRAIPRVSKEIESAYGEKKKARGKSVVKKEEYKDGKMRNSYLYEGASSGWKKTPARANFFKDEKGRPYFIFKHENSGERYAFLKVEWQYFETHFSSPKRVSSAKRKFFYKGEHPRLQCKQTYGMVPYNLLDEFDKDFQEGGKYHEQILASRKKVEDAVNELISLTNNSIVEDMRRRVSEVSVKIPSMEDARKSLGMTLRDFYKSPYR